jgi:cytochrome c oxidase subunit 2
VRNWSLFFLGTAALCTAATLYAPFDADWWLPRNLSSLGRQVDHLFLLTLAITGGVFLLTHLALGHVLWHYATRPGRQAAYSHGNRNVELVLTIIPAGILVFLSLYQMRTWADIKFASARPDVATLAEVTGRQFQWMMRYPGPDKTIGTADDLHTVNDLRFVKGQPVVIRLKSRDVIHSFFLPEMRVKQDAVPGLDIPVWFDADRAGTYELVCAELCGWGHYKMRATVTVYDTADEFNAWMGAALAKQSADQAGPQPAAPAGEAS